MVTMMLVIIILMLLKLPVSSAIDNDALKFHNMEQKLHIDLFKDYQGYDPPPQNETTVRIRFILKYFWFDENEEEFNIHTWAYLYWNDSRLAWKPQDYDNIVKAFVRSIFIWGPPFLFKNVNYLLDDTGVDVLSSSLCLLTYTGLIRATLQLSFRTTCKSNLHNWPYDIQYCSFRFEPDQFGDLYFQKNTNPHHKVNIYYPPRNGLAILEDLSYGAGWDILDYNTSYVRSNVSHLDFNFLIRREALGYATIVVVPSIALAIFTLCSMLLDVRYNIRIVIVIFSFFSHISLLEIISVFVPHQAKESPLILLFVCSSIIITAFVICLTAASNLVLRMQISSASKIVKFNECVLGTSLKYFIFPKWKVDLNVGTDDLSRVKETRITFISIVNSLFLYIFVVIYLILYCLYMPQPTAT